VKSGDRREKWNAFGTLLSSRIRLVSSHLACCKRFASSRSCPTIAVRRQFSTGQSAGAAPLPLGTNTPNVGGMLVRKRNSRRSRGYLRPRRLRPAITRPRPRRTDCGLSGLFGDNGHSPTCPRRGFACAIRTCSTAHAGASLLRSTGRPAASSYRPGDGHGHAALKALRRRETTGVCRKKSLWSGNWAIALRMWRMPTSTICAAVGWGEVG
jgi:hypothetical protein